MPTLELENDRAQLQAEIERLRCTVTQVRAQNLGLRARVDALERAMKRAGVIRKAALEEIPREELQPGPGRLITA